MRTFKITESIEISSITFRYLEDIPYIEIEAKDEEKAIKLEQKLNHFFMAAGCDGEFECNFSLDKEGTKLTITGNLYNAMEIIKAREIIPKNTINSINSDSVTNKIINGAKNCLPAPIKLGKLAVNNIMLICGELLTNEKKQVFLGNVIDELYRIKEELEFLPTNRQAEEQIESKLSQFAFFGSTTGDKVHKEEEQKGISQTLNVTGK